MNFFEWTQFVCLCSYMNMFFSALLSIYGSQSTLCYIGMKLQNLYSNTNISMVSKEFTIIYLQAEGKHSVKT